MTAVLPAQRVLLSESADAEYGTLLSGMIGSDPVAQQWTIRTDQTWTHADRTHSVLPLQGWKLHVSATVLSAAEMVAACAPILLRHDCEFKIARTLDIVEMLTNAHTPRGNAGKVLTAYPATDEQAVSLSTLLDEATAGLSGPRILSDRAVREGSLVHYRYGVFGGVRRLDNDGSWELALRGPDGRLVSDRREGSFTPPAWVRDPFVVVPDPGEGPPPRQPGQVLLAERYAVHKAIRHANRGGVFRGTDQSTGSAVVVKQARAHVGTRRDGTDSAARLRHEAAVLGRLAHTGWVPRPVALVTQGTDLFLVEDDLGGITLRVWVSRELASPDWSPRRALDLLVDIADMLVDLHATGAVLRDVSPNNILVSPDGVPALIDLECASIPGELADLSAGMGTMAYSPAEQFAKVTTDASVDSHAFGAVILYCLTGEDPLVGRPGSPDTLADWLTAGLRSRRCPERLSVLARQLCSADPGDRPSLARARDVLADVRAMDPVGASALTRSTEIDMAFADLAPMTPDQLDDAITELIRRLRSDVRPTDARIARGSTFGETTLPSNVQHGAAGVLGVLLQILRSEDGTDEVAVLATSVARWLADRIDQRPEPGPVGLYFGYAGAAWALADAGRRLDRPDWTAAAVQHALALPTAWPSPDVTHGQAGLGLTLLHLMTTTGDQRLVPRLDQIAESLSMSAELDDFGVFWRTPADAPSAFAGQRFFGFAHGTAGIGLFLLQHSMLRGSGRSAELAKAAVETLHRGVVTVDGVSRWGSSPESPAPALTHWCNGSSGVLTFLARAKGAGLAVDDTILDQSARAIVADKWRSGIAYCHGLAGNADALLDLAEVLDGPYTAWASALAALMWTRRTTDEVGSGLTDEIDRITPDFSVGYGGPLSTLLRLRDGGPRLWLPVVSR